MPSPTATSRMLIRRPPRAVFDAFASAETICRFWLTATSGPLAAGAVVTWDFMVPGAQETVTVTAFDVGDRIAFDWSSGLKVEMTFEPLPGDSTRASVVVSGFEDDKLLESVANVIEGFTIVLCDLKTLLEHGRSANLVRDKAELITRSMHSPG